MLSGRRLAVVDQAARELLQEQATLLLAEAGAAYARAMGATVHGERQIDRAAAQRRVTGAVAR